jgi:hypothetical protein
LCRCQGPHRPARQHGPREGRLLCGASPPWIRRPWGGRVASVLCLCLALCPPAVRLRLEGLHRALLFSPASRYLPSGQRHTPFRGAPESRLSRAWCAMTRRYPHRAPCDEPTGPSHHLLDRADPGNSRPPGPNRTRERLSVSARRRAVDSEHCLGESGEGVPPVRCGRGRASSYSSPSTCASRTPSMVAS